MTTREALQEEIVIHWWNFGKKTLEFRGTMKEYLRRKNITFRKIKHPEIENNSGYVFKVDFGGATIRYKCWGTFEEIAPNIIAATLNYLGDKSYFEYNNRATSINYHR